MEAISHAGTCLGVLASNGVVLAAEKKIASKLLEHTRSSEKIFILNELVFLILILIINFYFKKKKKTLTFQTYLICFNIGNKRPKYHIFIVFGPITCQTKKLLFLLI